MPRRTCECSPSPRMAGAAAIQQPGFRSRSGLWLLPLIGREFPPPGGLGLRNYRGQALQHIGFRISRQQLHSSDEQAQQMILSWADAKLPNFRKLQ